MMSTSAALPIWKTLKTDEKGKYCMHHVGLVWPGLGQAAFAKAKTARMHSAETSKCHDFDEVDIGIARKVKS